MLQTYNILPLYTRRAALEKWKQNLGANATYNNLIGVFECAGYHRHADTVRKLVLGFSSNLMDDSSNDKVCLVCPPSPSTPLPQPPVFPEPESISSSWPLPHTTAAAVLIEDEHQEGRTNYMYVEEWKLLLTHIGKLWMWHYFVPWRMILE